MVSSEGRRKIGSVVLAVCLLHLWVKIPVGWLLRPSFLGSFVVEAKVRKRGETVPDWDWSKAEVISVDGLQSVGALSGEAMKLPI